VGDEEASSGRGSSASTSPSRRPWTLLRLEEGQTYHRRYSVVERELGLELDKTHQSSDWGETLTPEMIEYAAKDVEVLPPSTKSSMPRSKMRALPTSQRSSTAPAAVVWG
jgi:hypothetical protein